MMMTMMVMMMESISLLNSCCSCTLVIRSADYCGNGKTVAVCFETGNCQVRPAYNIITFTVDCCKTSLTQSDPECTILRAFFSKKTFRGRGTVLQQPTADVLYCEILLSCCTALCFVDITAVITINLQRCFTCHVELRSVFDYWSAFTYP